MSQLEREKYAFPENRFIDLTHRNFEIIGPCAIDHTTRENPDPETFEHYRQGPHPFCNGDILAIAPQEESLLLQECQGFSQLLEKMLKQEALANKNQEKAPSAAPSKRH